MMSCASAERKDIYKPQPATLVRTEQFTALERFFEFRLDSGQQLGHMPGQFLEVSVPGIGEAPISVSSSPTSANGSFELVVRNVGNVTGALHRLEPDQKVGIRGPFGTHFPVDGAMQGADLLFICGGIGLVPVRSAIHYVLDNLDDYGDVTILFGARSPAERLFIEELADWAARPDLTFMETVDRADDSWEGHVGVVTTLMPEIETDPEDTIAITCGPPVMYKFVLMELIELHVPTRNVYVSLERHMKCGVGKCGHCQINGLYACQDGPVFRYADVEDAREAIQ
jgi:NAD(P)H-flavin reductase